MKEVFKRTGVVFLVLVFVLQYCIVPNTWAEGAGAPPEVAASAPSINVLAASGPASSVLSEAMDAFEYAKLRRLLWMQAARNRNTSSEAITPINNTNFVPNDPGYLNGYEWGMEKINMKDSWDLSRGAGVIVAVIDSGIDYNHVDLFSQLFHNSREIQNNGIDDDNNGYIDDYTGYDLVGANCLNPVPDANVMDGLGHGTHVSGIIAAANNGTGVIGMAPDAKLLPIKVTDDQGYNVTGETAPASLAQVLIKALKYAVDMGAKIINISMGTIGTAISSLVDAMQYAFNRGAIVCVAAGNETANVQNYYPANMNGVITVAATDSNDNVASFSNYGSAIDVAAPGVDIWSTYPGNYFAEMSGTSMAAPFVSGLAALMESQAIRWGTTLTYDGFLRRLQYSSVDKGTAGWDEYFGWGRIDAYKALSYDWYVSGRTKTYFLATADTDGAIRYDYFDENWNSQGYGRKSILYRATANAKGEMAFRYEYFTGTNTVMRSWAYTDQAMTTLRARYEYAQDGTLQKEVTGTTYTYYPDGRIKSVTYLGAVGGNTYLEYLDEEWNGLSHGRIMKQVLASADSDGARSYTFSYPASDDVVVVSLGGPGKDVVVNFGTSGVYKGLSGSTWTLLSDYQAKSIKGTNLDASGTDDIIFDFGAHGIWKYVNNSTWTFLTDRSADSITIADIDGGGKDDVICDLGANGLWKYMNNSTWAFMTDLNAENIVSADINGDGMKDLVCDFGSHGLYKYTNNSTWTYLTDLNAETITVVDLDADSKSDIVCDFGAKGLYKYTNNSTWTRMSDLNAKRVIVANMDGVGGKNDLICDFGANGLYKYGNNATWTRLTDLDADNVVVGDIDGDGKDDLVCDFGANGLYKYTGNSTWTWLTGLNAENIVLANVDGGTKKDIICDFGSNGLYKYMNNSTWTKMTDLDAVSISVADLDGNGNEDIICDFGTQGFWKYMNNTTWTYVSSLNADRKATQEGYQNADFTGLVYTATYDVDGKLVSKSFNNADVITYYTGTGLMESKRLSLPDASGNVYYHYMNENFNAQGYGRVDKVVMAAKDPSGAIAYEYVYQPGTNVVAKKIGYAVADFSNPAAPVFSSPVDPNIWGANLPWVSYGNDIGSPVGQGFSSAASRASLQSLLSERQGSVVRVFLFCDLRSGVTFNANGTMSFTDKAKVWADMDALLQVAAANNVKVLPVLFDRTLGVVDDQNGTRTGAHPEVITDVNKRAALISLLATDFMDRYINNPNIYAWDILNEPEVAPEMKPGVVTNPQQWDFIRAFADMINGKLQAAGSKELLTTGNKDRKYMIDMLNYWQAQGHSNVLSLYQFHYYDAMGKSDLSPLSAAEKTLTGNRPVIVGEVSSKSDPRQLGTKNWTEISEKKDYLSQNGFAGGLFWHQIDKDGQPINNTTNDELYLSSSEWAENNSWTSGITRTSYASGRRESKTFQRPDYYGAVYYHYQNDDSLAPGFGKIDKVVYARPGYEGAIAFRYEYPADSSIDYIVHAYSNADFSNPSNPVLTNEFKTYTYYHNGNITGINFPYQEAYNITWNNGTYERDNLEVTNSTGQAYIFKNNINASDPNRFNWGNYIGYRASWDSQLELYGGTFYFEGVQYQSLYTYSTSDNAYHQTATYYRASSGWGSGVSVDHSVANHPEQMASILVKPHINPLGESLTQSSTLSVANTSSAMSQPSAIDAELASKQDALKKQKNEFTGTSPKSDGMVDPIAR